MLIYIFLLIAFIALYLLINFFIKDEKKNKLFSSLIPAILLFVVLGLKASSVGADSKTYVNAYYDIGNISKFPSSNFFTELNSFNFGGEYGFILTAQLFRSLHLPYLVFQIFIYAIICFSLFYSTYKLSKCSISSFFVFYCFSYFNFFVSGLRQSFAISLCLLALSIIISGKRTIWRTILYFSLITIATLWHKSAIIFLIPYFLINVKIGFKGFISFLAFSFFLMIFGEQMYQTINDFSGLFFGKNVADYAPFNFGNGLSNFVFIAILVFCFFITYPSKIKTKIAIFISEKINFLNVKEKEKYVDKINEKHHLDGNLSFFLLMSFVGLCLRYTSSYSVAFGRIAMYFSIFVIFLLPNSVETISNTKLRNTVKCILAVAFIGYFIYTVVLTNYLSIAPYKIIEGTI